MRLSEGPESESVAATVDLTGLPFPALADLVTRQGGTPRQAAVLMQALHRQRPDALADLVGPSRALLARLMPGVTVRPLATVRVVESPGWSGTTKLLLKTAEGLPVEAVLFGAAGDPGRMTLCVSSQVGCKMGCVFCATGHMGFLRHLTAGEIVAQVWAALDRMDGRGRLNNVVFMGMGEPLENFEAVRDACGVLHDERGLSLAWRKITVSTVGHLPGLRRLAGEGLKVSLAVSLHAGTDELRSRLVPTNRVWGLPALFDTLRAYPRGLCPVLCIEYCLIDGVNDDRDQAVATARLMEGLRHKIHLIPFNPVPGLPFRAPSRERVLDFARWIEEEGGSVLVRHSRGPDIEAACGQLGAQYMTWKECHPGAGSPGITAGRAQALERADPAADEPTRRTCGATLPRG